MKSLKHLPVIVILMLAGWACQVSEHHDTNSEVENKVEQLLTEMTLEKKSARCAR